VVRSSAIRVCKRSDVTSLQARSESRLPRRFHMAISYHEQKFSIRPPGALNPAGADFLRGQRLLRDASWIIDPHKSVVAMRSAAACLLRDRFSNVIWSSSKARPS
jgi:hypothetical protein